MATKGLEAKTVGLKVKTTKFQVRTLDSTGHTYVSSADDLFSASSALLQREIRGAPGGKLRLRLMGIKASGFRGQAGAPILPGQVTLDGFLKTAKTDDEEGEACEKEERKGEEEEDEEGKVSEQERCVVAAATAMGREVVAAAGPKAAGPVSSFDYPFAGASLVRSVDRRAASSITAAACSPRSTAVPAAVQRKALFFGGSSSRGPLTAATATNVACPVCGEELGVTSNAALNHHLDACLGVCATAGETRGGGGGGGRLLPQRSGGGRSPRKRAKVSAAGIERFLTSKEQAQYDII